VKKKNAKSIVWDYFGLRAEEDGTVKKTNELRPVCRKCYKHILCKGGNTSNLFSHLRDKHPALYKEANKSKGTVTVAASPSAPSSSRSDVATSGTQETLPSAIKRHQSYSSDSPRAQQLTQRLHTI